jgi:hypothetical protein
VHIAQVLALSLVSFSAFAQSDRGTVTGTIADPAGAIIASAPVEVSNTETGASPGSQFGTSSAYYDDYRQQRRPQESLGFGRQLPITEKVSLNIRAEFTHVLNRTERNNPASTNALATQLRNADGKTTGGFGWVGTASVAMQPRQGTIVARIRF